MKEKTRRLSIRYKILVPASLLILIVCLVAVRILRKKKML